jgi:leader peptidase (prepilin peptidase)/N-methyltransferase
MEFMPHGSTSGVVFGIFALLLGAVVGSFLNACIHRMPRGVGLGTPRRSFCPGCERVIPWYENLPLVSWLALRGRCAGCGWRIPFRYFLVEALTALLFAVLWERFGLPLAPVYWAFASLLVVATFIDFEHFIIPDEITWGGAAAGVLFSIAIPELMDSVSRLESLACSLGGASLGFALLFLVVEGGKLAFGKIRHAFPQAEDFEWRREGERIVLTLAGEDLEWVDIFSRERDVLTIELEGAASRADGTEMRGMLKFWHDRYECDGREGALDGLERLSGKMKSVVIPREAMGFGDVKFIACIGAFLGWQAVLFTIFAASIIGSVTGFAGIALARDRAGVRIPFGPFLALGALLWLFGGRDWVDWYFSGLSISKGYF